MTLFTVDTEKCARDGICEQECPTRIIEFRSKEDFPKPIKEAEQFCIACGHCVAVCPHEAISLKWLKPEDCRSINQEWALDLKNITNHQNIFMQSYDPANNSIHTDYQQGFFPMFLYRIQF